MKRSESASTRLSPAEPVERTPLSISQQRLWFLEQLEPGNPVFRLSQALDLAGALDLRALRRAVDGIVHRHDALRAAVATIAGQPVRTTAPSTLPLPVVDLAALEACDRRIELHRLAVEHARRPFALERGPLLGLALLRLAPQEHVLVLTCHRLVADAASLEIFQRELMLLYQAFEPLPALPRSYAEYAERQRRWSDGEECARQLTYWRQQLADLPVIDLPTDRPRPPVTSYRGRRRTRPPGATDLHALSRREGIPLAAVVLAAFQLLLRRYTGQKEVVVGFPAAHRDDEETGVIGAFVNPLVLRSDLAGDPSVRELLARTAATLRAAQEHQELPFERLIDELQPQRDLTRPPLFQVVLDLRSAPPVAEAAGLRLERLALDWQLAEFDWTLEIVDTGHAAEVTLEYRVDLFDAATIGRVLGHWHHLLEELAAGVERRLSELALLGPAERHQLLLAWNDTRRPYPRDLLIHQLVARQAAATPSAPALVCGDDRLSYRELDAGANRLAHHLCRLGVGPEVLVGVCTRRSIDMVVGILAVLKAGGAYLPLDPEYPPERLAFMLEDAGTRVILTQEALCEALPEHRAERLCLDAGRPAWSAEPATDPGSPAAAGHLAYLIYTSGSTGRAKGVAITHRSAVAMIEWAGEVFSADEAAGVLASTSICFDLSIFELFVPLSRGGTVIVAENALALPTLPAAAEVTLVNTVPSALRELLRLAPLPPAVRTVNLAGEHFAQSLTEDAYAAAGVERVFNLYGPSEDTTYSTFAHLATAGPAPPPIGRPVANTRVFLLDRRLRPVPIGVAGELFLAGDGLARGYLNRPALSAAAWIPDSFAGAPGERLYRTGDLARYRGDGTLDFLGRRDHQIKLRGFRIELGEVEAALVRHPGVREAVAVIRAAGGGREDRRLVAYAVRENAAAALDRGTLRAYLGKSLPAYMVPAVIFLDDMPRTPSGKVDRRALPDPVADGLGDVGIGPRGPLEEILAGIWSEVLGCGRVSAGAHFFDLGGHSLLATQVASRVNRAFAVTIGPAQLFEKPTLAALAAEIGRLQAAAQGTPQEPLVPVAGSGPAPLSSAQERLWFLDHYQPGSTAYNLATPLHFRGSLEPEALRRSFAEIVRRHEILRTTFTTAAEQSAQVVSPGCEQPLPWVDLTGPEEEDRSREVERLIRRDEGRPFDLSRGPLFRHTLLRLAGDEHVLLLCCHHIVFDGWSQGVVIRELAQLYPAFLAGQPSPLGPLAIQYRDFALWQRQWLRGPQLAAQLDYWRSQLGSGQPAAVLTPDRPRQPGASRVRRRRFAVDAAAAEALRRLGREQGATLYMILAAAFQTLLHRHTRAAAVTVGTPIAHRNRCEIEELIGFFVNTQVLRSDFSDDPPFRQLLDRVREATLGAYAHQDVPFEKLVEALAPERRAEDRQPLFQAMFVFQNAPLPPLELPGVTLRPLAVEAGGRAAMFDLSLAMQESGERIEGSLEYDETLFEAATIDTLVDHYRRLLEGIAAHPERRVSALELPPIAGRPAIAGRPPIAGRPAAAAPAAGEEAAGEDKLAAEKAAADQVRAKVSRRRGRLSEAQRALLARRLKGEAPAAAPAAATIPRRPQGAPAPLSFAQEQLWFLDQLTPGMTAYSMPFPLRLQGRLDRAALAAGFAAIRRRHEIVRATFQAPGGKPRMMIGRVAGDLPLVDLTALPAPGRDRELARWADAERRRPFDLGRGPLLRTALLRLAAEEHVLLFNAHHIVFDGVSMDILIRELGLFYEARCAGRDAALEALPIQYADYAHWQRQWLEGQVLERQMGYWKRQLAAAPPVLELPADRPRPPHPSFRGKVLPVELGEELSGALAALSQRREATLFMTLLAAFQALLYRITGQQDLLVGTPIAGRPRKELEVLIGFFVNTLVLRTDLAGTAGRSPSFADLVARVRQVALDAYAHQDLPFERLVEELQPRREGSFNPLFQVMFAFQSLASGGLRTPALVMSSLPPAGVTAKFDLTLILDERGAGISGTLEYSTELFDESTMRRFVLHFQHLLAGIVADPAQRLTELPLLGPVERQQLIAEWNDHAALQPRWELPDRATLGELLAARAARAPEAVAVVCGGAAVDERVLSYRELDARAHRLADQLRALGVAAEVPVGIAARPGPELVVGLVGILQAGGVYLPLDPTLPAERLTFMLRDAGARVVLAGDAVAASLPPPSNPHPPAPLSQADPPPSRERGGKSGDPPGFAVVSLDGPQAAASREAPPLRLHPQNLAYIIYTSGTTGVPKGVGVSHRQVLPILYWFLRYFPIDERTRVLQTLSYCFDFGLFELLTTLLAGGTLWFLPAEEQGDPSRSLEAVARHRINTVHATPSFFRELARPGRGLEGLATVHLGGEALSRDLVRQIAAAADADCRVYNGYGPTETSINSAIFALREPGFRGETVPIGRITARSTGYVVDPRGRPLPMGVPGELVIGGEGVARGYQNRPALTAERFLPDPLAAAAGTRLYRTGDLVRWLGDGNIEFLGRIDHQVKIRGFRLELGEIEAVLRQAPGVGECAVLARGDRAGSTRLIAYVVAADPAPGAEELRGWLDERLPDYMVPWAFELLDQMPRTPSGKLDRADLGRRPLPERQRPEAAAAAGENPGEQLLAGIWCEVLGVERVGRDDDFFQLGGHSLLATQVVSRVRELFEVEVPLQRLFDAPTVAGLAAALEPLRAEGRAVAPPVVPVAREAAGMPLSFAQERLWFLDQLEPGTAAYNVPAAVRLSGGVDAARLERALNAVAARHEALRTTFAPAAGRPYQVIAPRIDLPLPGVDLRRLPAAAGEAEARRLATAEALAPFDLAAGPLIRATLLELAPDDHVLLVTMHHIVSDGWSIGIFLRELTAFWDGTPLAPLPVQYADYAHWQRGWLRGEVLEAELGYWRKQLAGIPQGPQLPTDRPRPARQSFRGGSCAIALDPELSAALAALGRRTGTTLYMTLLAIFQLLLHRVTGQDDAVVGSPVAGRGTREIEGLIGFFINTLVLRSDLAADVPFAELLAAVRGVALDAYAHQELPFERLVEELQPERNLSTSPLFQVLFVLQNAPQPAIEIPDLRLETMPFEGETAKFDLGLALAEAGDRIEGVLEYNRDLFDAVTAERLAGHFRDLAAAVVDDPGRRISQLPWLTPGQRHQLLVEWNDSAVDEGPGHCVHELFAAQAARRPEATALTFEREHLSYGELDRRTNQLAHHLRALGVGPEMRVGLCAERSVELVVGMLGILKAGGAYVPLDPEYPLPRLQFMAETAGVALVLTREKWLEALPSLAGPTLCLDRDRPAIDARPATPPAPLAGPDHLIYAIFTSGSTGQPKGSLVAHRGVVNRLLWGQETYGLAAGEAVMQKTPFTFDVSVWEFFWPLVAGGRLVLARPGGHRDSTYLARLVREERVSTIHFVASMLGVFVEEPELRTLPLERVIASGEALPPALAERFAGVLGAELHNLYGPTEASIEVTSWRCRPTDVDNVPIGRPVANLRIHLLDRHLEPVPPPVVGELHIAGVGLARGYVERPALTAERFIPDPRSPTPGGRLYRSGDLARWRPDGAVEYLGRLDHQIKIRGFRVELGEIETVLGRAPGVREAVVLARADGEPAAAVRLVAYAVADRPEEELRAYLADRLPKYMVPWAFELVDAMPLNPSGKVDRAALGRRPLPDRRRPAAGPAPENPHEQLVAEIWAQVLGLDRIGRDDNFFQLGGHSLLATQVTSRVREAFGVELPLHRLFEAPTVAGLTRLITAARHDAPAAPPLVPALPPELSFAQERLWFLEQLDPGSVAYNLFAALRLRGDLDPAALAAALGEVMRRHRTLSSRFEDRRGRPVLVLDPAAEPPLPLVDLSALAPAERDAEGRRGLDREAQRPFDLARGPLLRALLVRLEAQTHALLVTIHHIVTDGWSMDLLTRELAAAYGALVRRQAAGLPELPIQYPDYAAWQRRWLVGETLEAQLAWWRDYLGGELPVLRLPADSARPAMRRPRGGQASRRLPAALRDQLLALGRGRGATLFMTLLAVFALLLGRLSGQRDLLVGTPIAGRTRRELEELIGLFLNTLVLRAELGGGLTFEQLLARVRAAALGAYDHQEVPFEQLVAELDPGRDLSRTPLVQVLFNLLNFGGETLPELPSLTSERLEVGAELPSKFDLTLYAVEGPEGLELTMAYDAGLFARERIEEMLDQLAGLLAQVVERPGERIDDYSLVTPSRRALLPDPQAALPPEPPFEPVSSLFLGWAERQPEEPAVRCGERVRSYRELASEAGEIARRLRARGAGRGTVVAISGERGPELIAGMLGVMLAGSVLLLVDRKLPSPRQRVMMTEAGARFLILAGIRSESGTGTGTGTGQMPGIGILPVPRHDSPPAAAVESAAIAADDPAYVFFTSGTTGVPKGVLGRHKGLSHFLTWQRDAFAIAPGDRVAQLTSLSFDVVLRDVFLPLVSGASLEIPEREDLSPGYVLPWLERCGVTAMHTVPSLVATWLTDVPADLRLPSLRWIFSAGEPLSDGLVRRWREVFPGAGGIVNLYGPTETTLAKCCHRVADPPEPGIQPIGSPLPHTQALVLGRSGGLCGIGELGEIVLRTPFRSLGYVNAALESARRFRPNPFAAEAGDLLYFTGDGGRYRLDGELAIYGRLDDQVKIRGMRVEPAEIRAVVESHPRVRSSAVLARKDHAGEPQLVAWVVADEELRYAELREWLREKLPDYMVPAAVVPLERLPLLPNGKVDRRALPAPEAVGRDAEIGRAPRDAVELALAQLWEELLGVERIDVRGDFFDLGGHSLLAVRLMAAIRTRFGRELPLEALFRGATVERLAAVLREDGEAAQPLLVEIQGGGSRLPLFCIHPVMGTVLCYGDLARALSPEQPVYAHRARGLLAGEMPQQGIEEMAASYLRAVREVRPQGPYVLLGWSMGGVVAYEMARQLVEAGQEVALLALVDTRAREVEEPRFGTEAEMFAWAISDEVSISLESIRSLDAVLREAREAGVVPPDFTVADARRQLEVYQACRQAAWAYRPAPYAGRVVLFQATEEPLSVAADWQQVVGGEIEVHRVPGSHQTMVCSPHVRGLAEQLHLLLDGVQ